MDGGLTDEAGRDANRGIGRKATAKVRAGGDASILLMLMLLPIPYSWRLAIGWLPATALAYVHLYIKLLTSFDGWGSIKSPGVGASNINWY